MCSAKIREIASVAPPGANGTTNVMGPVGNAWALALGLAAAKSAIIETRAAETRRMN
jgi:hypothetical protein